MLQRREYDSAASVAANSANASGGSWVIDPLPGLQRGGLIAVATLAMVSLAATFALLSFFTYRFIFWKKYYKRYIGYNQYVVLMYNLALADFIQGLGFIVSLRWISQDSLHATDAGCFLQGIWLQIGDPMSGMFVLAIALHTFMHVSLGRQLSHKVFVSVVVGLWVFGVILTVIPIAIYGRYVWVPSVAWVRLYSLPVFFHLLQNFLADILNLIVLDGHTTSYPSPLDTLLLDLCRSVLEPCSLRHYVRPTPTQDGPIEDSGSELHRESPPPEPSRLLHGDVPHCVHRLDTPIVCRPHGIRQWKRPQCSIFLCRRRYDDPLRILRCSSVYPDQEERRVGGRDPIEETRRWLLRSFDWTEEVQKWQSLLDRREGSKFHRLCCYARHRLHRPYCSQRH
jgi:hypothetical protein